MYGGNRLLTMAVILPHLIVGTGVPDGPFHFVYRSFHRNREVNKFIVGRGFISRRLFWFNRSFTADRRGRRSIQCMLVIVHLTIAVNP